MPKTSREITAKSSSAPFSRSGRTSTVPGMQRREMPSTSPVLQDTDPTALPSAIAPDPWAAASTETSSSGMVVPRLTTVAATTKGGMPVTRAIHRAPSTKLSPPFTISANPSRNNSTTPAILHPSSCRWGRQSPRTIKYSGGRDRLMPVLKLGTGDAIIR